MMTYAGENAHEKASAGARRGALPDRNRKPAPAQDWPAQPIHIIVAFGAGGGADIIGRILADAMQERLGKPVIVENKPGAGGILGNELVAHATPDGYTLGIMTAGQIIAAVTRKDMPYDTAALTPVAQVASASLLIVTRPDFPANSVKELVEAAKADPGKIVFASPGLRRHPAFCRRIVQADRRREFAACAVPQLARSHQRGARQTRRRAVRYGLGAARPSAVRRAQSARGDRQGPVSRRAEHPRGEQIRRAAGL